MMKFFFAALLTLSIGLAAAETTADGRVDTGVKAAPTAKQPALYQIEFIVVRPTNRPDLQSEDWSTPRPSLASDGALKGQTHPAQPLAKTANFSWVKSPNFDLPSTLERLKKQRTV